MRYLITILSLFTWNACAATWYAAVNGSTTNGTYAQPWSIEYATQSTNSHLAAGDTVILKNGTYYTYQTNSVYGPGPWKLFLMKSGTLANPIIYKAESLWGFKVHGTVLLPFENEGVKWMYTEVFNTSLTNRLNTNNIYMGPGIDLYGSNVWVMHNLIHNVGHPGIGAWRTAVNKTIAGNVIMFPGYIDWSDGYSGAIRGSGMYLENETGAFPVYGNIEIHGLSSAFLFKNYIVSGGFSNNIVYNPGQIAFHLQNKNQDPVNGLMYMSNHTFMVGDTVGMSLGAGGYDYYDGGQGSNVVISGNYVVGGSKSMQMQSWWRTITATNNTFVKNSQPPIGDTPVTEFNIFQLEQLGQTNSVIYTFLGNKYYQAAGNWPFNYWALYSDWDGWRTNTGETGSYYGSHLPTNNVVSAFRPTEDTNFVHVAVYNWETNTSTSVDISSYFTAGDSLKVYDVQNMPNVLSNITYAGGSITLPLDRTNAATWWGYTNINTTFDSRFRSFVIYKTTESPTGGKIRAFRFGH